MTDDTLTEIETHLASATAGPWRTQIAACDHMDTEDHSAIKGGAGALVSGCIEWEPDATFIAHAREDIPALIAEVRRLREEHDALHNDISALIAHVEDHGEDAASDEVYVALLPMRKPPMSPEPP